MLFYRLKMPFCEELDAGGGAANTGGEPGGNAQPGTEGQPSGGQEPTGGQQTSQNQPGAEDVTKTQAFAHRLKEEKNKALDEFIAAEGYNYNGKPIKTYAEYQTAQAEIKAAKDRQEFQQKNGFDPDAVKPLFEQFKENDPDFQELKQIRQEKNINMALGDLNAELQKLNTGITLKDLSNTELSKLPNLDEISRLVKSGITLANAYKIANMDSIISGNVTKAKNETIERINANGASSPGALGEGGNPNNADMWNMSDKDFKALQEKALRGELKKS